jgi:hypothetical protein
MSLSLTVITGSATCKDTTPHGPLTAAWSDTARATTASGLALSLVVTTNCPLSILEVVPEFR